MGGGDNRPFSSFVPNLCRCHILVILVMKVTLRVRFIFVKRRNKNNKLYSSYATVDM